VHPAIRRQPVAGPPGLLLAALVCLWLVPGAAAAGEGLDVSVIRVPDGAASEAADLTRMNAAVFPASAGRLAPYLGAEAASVPEPEHSAGIATDEGARLDLRARAGLRLAAGPDASLRLFVTLAAATLDADNRLDARAAVPLAGLGLAFVRGF
jgi:hypothetical protein